MTKKTHQHQHQHHHTHRIIIHAEASGQPQPVRLHIGSRPAASSRALPVNVPITVDDDELSALQNSDHQITIEGSTAADEAVVEAPAPAGSGDGGDAGGGGDSGEPAAETPEQPQDPA